MSDRPVTAECPVRLRKVMNNYAEVFSKELDIMKSVKTRIQVNQETQLRFFKAHLVPYALKPKVEKERLQGVGTVEPVRFSERAAPVVPMPKSDQTVCICGEIDSEPGIKAGPVSNFQDGSPIGNSGQWGEFTKLDMSQAY